MKPHALVLALSALSAASATAQTMGDRYGYDRNAYVPPSAYGAPYASQQAQPAVGRTLSWANKSTYSAPAPAYASRYQQQNYGPAQYGQYAPEQYAPAGRDYGQAPYAQPGSACCRRTPSPSVSRRRPTASLKSADPISHRRPITTGLRLPSRPSGRPWPRNIRSPMSRRPSRRRVMGSHRGRSSRPTSRRPNIPSPRRLSARPMRRSMPSPMSLSPVRRRGMIRPNSRPNRPTVSRRPTVNRRRHGLSRPPTSRQAAARRPTFP